MTNAFDYFTISGTYKDESEYHESPFYTFSEAENRRQEMKTELKTSIISAVDNDGTAYPIAEPFNWVLLKALKSWSIEIDRGKREIACRPTGYGCPCFGYLNEEKDGFRWDRVPPAYVRNAALKAAKKVDMVSIYTEVEAPKMETVPIGSFEITLPIDALNACYHQGQCDQDVSDWHGKINWASVGMTPLQIRSELEQFGAWEEEELSNDVENQKKILWVAAGDYQENKMDNEL